VTRLDNMCASQFLIRVIAILHIYISICNLSFMYQICYICMCEAFIHIILIYRIVMLYSYIIFVDMYVWHHYTYMCTHISYLSDMYVWNVYVCIAILKRERESERALIFVHICVHHDFVSNHGETERESPYVHTYMCASRFCKERESEIEPLSIYICVCIAILNQGDRERESPYVYTYMCA